jgi:hypothetical protein
VHADRLLGDLETSMPSMFDAVPVKYFSTSDFARPTASNCCEPVYDM